MFFESTIKLVYFWLFISSISVRNVPLSIALQTKRILASIRHFNFSIQFLLNLGQFIVNSEASVRKAVRKFSLTWIAELIQEKFLIFFSTTNWLIHTYVKIKIILAPTASIKQLSLTICYPKHPIQLQYQHIFRCHWYLSIKKLSVACEF